VQEEATRQLSCHQSIYSSFLLAWIRHSCPTPRCFAGPKEPPFPHASPGSKCPTTSRLSTGSHAVLGTKLNERHFFAEIAQESPCAAPHISARLEIVKTRPAPACQGAQATAKLAHRAPPRAPPTGGESCNILKTQPLSASGPATIGFHKSLP